MQNRIVTENRLDLWVRGNARKAQGVIVDLVCRLVTASCPNPKCRRFPLGDSIGQPGPDGFLEVDNGFDPFVPEGRSYWEVSASIDARSKATEDYRNLSDTTPDAIRRESSFVFVTPLSGTRDWADGWKARAQSTWLHERHERNEWRDVRVVDGSRLIDWLSVFPAVERWLADVMRIPAQQVQTPEQRWQELRTIGHPAPLTPEVFLANREEACDSLEQVFSRTKLQVKLETRFPREVADFVAAYVAGMREDAKVDAVGRCLIISSSDAWNTLATLHEPHVLVADFDLDDADSACATLLDDAQRRGHFVIFGGMPGGMPQADRVPLPSPKRYQIEQALQEAGYNEERARGLAQRSGGNLSSLLRCLQNLPLVPQWAQGADAEQLAIAELMGGWSEHSEADRAVAEMLSGKGYPEWIGKMREIALSPGTPLIQRDDTWKVTACYVGWYALGPRLFDEHLDRLREASVSALREQDPQFELAPGERWAAGIHGKHLAHSRLLRKGLADSLALLGSHPSALVSCSVGKAQATASLAVRETLADADWVLWASLSDVLPLLAEAAPEEFVDGVETALNSDPCPFDTIFAQEGDGITGSNHMTGLLWALETLAWEPEHVTRVLVVLGELARRDPGGTWGNRPANSLSTILLPWLPQTRAPLSKRLAAVRTLLAEVPDVAWRLLLALLPSLHQLSVPSRRPVWRESIPDDWSEGVTLEEYWEQNAAYAELAINAAQQDLSELAELIDRLGDLPDPARSRLLAHLGSEEVVSMSQVDRLRLWTQLVDLVSKHRRFAEAQWAMKSEVVTEIAAVAQRLAPEAPYHRHQRLFRERDLDLYSERGNYEQQRAELQDRRDEAMNEVYAAGGVHAVLEFAKAVESPRRAGMAFAAIATTESEREILPALLESDTRSLSQFAEGFVSGRFRARGWEWVDGIETSQWLPAQKGQLLAYLPFTPAAWERSAQLLGEDESSYWSKTQAYPYEAKQGLELAVDRLLEHARPLAAIRCLAALRHDKQPLDNHQAVRVLGAVQSRLQEATTVDAQAIVEVIQALQEDPGTVPDDLMRIEWAFLPLLDGHHGTRPRLLAQRLAEDPGFFCEVIRAAFRSRKEDPHMEEPTEQRQHIARNAYHLLSQWHTPPGLQNDGTYCAEALTGWLGNVRTACAKSGHLEVALQMVGQVLAHVPPDSDGFWIHRSAAEALNARDADLMREGFRTELFNSRGPHWVDPKGQGDRSLAAKYRAQAEEADTQGYHRLASCIRQLASFYDYEARRQATISTFDE